MYLLVCPSCKGAALEAGRWNFSGYQFDRLRVFPKSGAFAPAPSEAPQEIATDFNEANQVLEISPKASAALSRRCMQAVLTDAGYANPNLAKQVDDVLNEDDSSKSLPTDLQDSLDAIRNFGNFSAHPITDKTSLQVIEVDVGEAEWCLQLVQDLFQHYYVRPSRAALRRKELNEKLSAAGKPPMKG